jgi:hypothetical protein
VVLSGAANLPPGVETPTLRVVPVAVGWTLAASPGRRIAYG